MVVHPNKETEPCNINVVMLCSSCGLAVMSSCGYLSHSSSSQTSIGALIFPRRISRQNSFRFNVLILFPHLYFFCRGNNVISPDFTRFFAFCASSPRFHKRSSFVFCRFSVEEQMVATVFIRAPLHSARPAKRTQKGRCDATRGASLNA